MLTHSQQQAKGGPLTTRWSFWLTPSCSQPMALAKREGGGEEPSKSGEGGWPEPRLWGDLQVTLSGAVGDSLHAHLWCVGWTEVLTAQNHRSTSVMEPQAPFCGPQPLVGREPSLSSSSAAPSSLHISPPTLSLLEWDSSLSLGLLPLTAESWRTVWPSPKSSCLSWFIKPTTQGVSRNAGLVVIFHVINKDSFV